MSEDTGFVSILPSEAEAMVERPDDFDFTIQDMNYAVRTIGTTDNLGIEADLLLENGSVYTEFLKLGGTAINNFEVVGEGKLLKNKPGNVKGLNDKCGAMKFLNSVVQHGFPEAKIAEARMHLDVFKGLQAHGLRVGTGFEFTNERTGNKTEAKALVVTKIHQLPWESDKKSSAKPKAAAAKGGNGAAKEAALEASEEDYNELAESTLVDILISADGPLARVQAGVRASQAFSKTDPAKARAISKLIADKTFVGGLTSVSYDAVKDVLAIA